MTQQEPAEGDPYAALGRALASIVEDAVYRGVRRALAEAGVLPRSPAAPDAGRLTLDPELAYSVREIAQFLKVAPDTVYGLLRSGKLRGRQLGVQRAVRIMGSAVQEYMAGADEL